MVSRVLALDVRDEELSRALEGCVGVAAATEFDLYRKSLRQLPKLERIVHGEDLFPSDPSTGYAVVTGLVARFGGEDTHTARLIEYARRLGSHGFRELEVLLVRDLLRRHPAVGRSPAFRAWAKENVAALS